MQYSVKILVIAQCYLNKYNHSHLEQEFSIYLHHIQFAVALLPVEMNSTVSSIQYQFLHEIFLVKERLPHLPTIAII